MVNPNTPLYERPRVGGDILAYCTSCRLTLAHVIVSMLSSQPSKVLCKTCRKQHKFKREPGVRTEKASSSKKEKSYLRAEEYLKQRISESSASPRPYIASNSYRAGDVIQHQVFGMGLVEKVMTPKKIQVLFGVGEKILIHHQVE